MLALPANNKRSQDSQTETQQALCVLGLGDAAILYCRIVSYESAYLKPRTVMAILQFFRSNHKLWILSYSTHCHTSLLGPEVLSHVCHGFIYPSKRLHQFPPTAPLHSFTSLTYAQSWVGSRPLPNLFLKV